MLKVLILGSNGMLGSQVFKIMRLKEIEIYSTKRRIEEASDLQYVFGVDDLEILISRIHNLEYVINCIGAIPQRSSSPEDFRINSELPHQLQSLSEKFNFKVIQIATDCAFNGTRGRYSEIDSVDASDSYGASKVLGEIRSPNFMHIRCSIIGNDRESRSLYSWLVNHEKNSVINGYTNHYWNGITTLAFAKVVSGIVLNNAFVTGMHHLVPASSVTKFELLKLISKFEKRSDLSIIPYQTKEKIDRTLTTLNPILNQELWENGGYEHIPTIEDLVREFGFLNCEKGRG